MTRKTKNSLLSISFTLLLLSSGFVGLATATEPSLPDWAAIFSSDGSLLDQVDANGDPGANGVPDYQDLYGGIDAIFIEDNISDSLATDMSVRTGQEALADDLVYNGTVDAPHDIGNAHVMATRDASGGLQLYAGVELLSWAGAPPPPDTFVELEFNQGVIRLVNGEPWSINGDRTDGDLLVRFNFTAGVLSTVEFKQWAATSYQVLTSVAATGACQGTGPYVFCTGSPALAYPVGGYEVYDIYSTTVASVPPDGFAEVSMDVAGLLGSSTDFTSISIRTPTDIAFGNFSAMGYWATVNAASQGGN